MDITKLPDQRVQQIISSKAVRAAERIIGPRTGYDYRFNDENGKVHIHGKTREGNSTEVVVRV